eukprot:COSAG04_NODE_325_length_16785_cov_23.851792_18_plen_111_part_00
MLPTQRVRPLLGEPEPEPDWGEPEPEPGGGGAGGGGAGGGGGGAGRTLATSNFKRLYDPKQAPSYQDEVMSALRNLLIYYCRKHDLPEAKGLAFFEKLQKEAFTQGALAP